jgi:pimeloyl-ACP methyl ester carboxylesterase
MTALWLVPLLLLVLVFALGEGLSYRLTSRRAPNERRSPSEYGLTFEEIKFSSRDGLRLGGWWIPAKDSQRTVVFLHGHGGSMDPDVQYAPAMNAAGFNVMMFDFRGHGRSQGDFVSVGYLERQDALGALDWLAARGLERVGLLGFSMGGAVAMLTAPIAPQVRAIVSDGGIARLTSAVVGGLVEARVPRWAARPVAWLAVLFTSWRLSSSMAGAIRILRRVSSRRWWPRQASPNRCGGWTRRRIVRWTSRRRRNIAAGSSSTSTAGCKRNACERHLECSRQRACCTRTRPPTCGSRWGK